MKLLFTIEADTSAALVAQLRNLIEAINPPQAPTLSQAADVSATLKHFPEQAVGLISDSVSPAPIEAPAVEEKPARKPRAKKEAAPVATPETPAEVIEQDAADEAAESDTLSKGDITLESVRKALGEYVVKYGMDAAQADGPVTLTKLFGVGVTKLSQIPADQASIEKAYDAVTDLVENNPFNRNPVAVNG